MRICGTWKVTSGNCLPSATVLLESYTMNEAKEFSSTYIVNMIFNAFLCCTAIVLNSITIHAVRKTSSLPKPLKTLLLSLAVSDLSVGLLVHPLYIASLALGLEQNTEDMYNTPYRIAFTIIGDLLAWAMFFGVLALTVDRFLSIHLHLRYQECVTHKRAVAVVISIMLLSSFLSSFPWWLPGNFRQIYAAIDSFSFLIFTILYCKIYSTVRRHKNQIQSLQVQQDEGQNREIMANVARLVKLAVGTFYIYLVFLLCCLPYTCLAFVEIISGLNTTTNHILYYSWTVIFLNSSLNPLIYCWKMRQIRRTVINIMQNIFRC